MSRLDRQILREILAPFLLSVGCVAVIVFLFQMQRLATAAVGMGLTFRDVAVLFLAALPPFMVLAVPLAYLLAVLIGLGRMAGDLEIVALLSSGAGPFRIARIPIALGALVSALSFPIAYHGEPYGLQVLYDRLLDLALRNISGAVEPGVFNESFSGLALYAGARTADGALKDVLLFDERDPARPLLVLADRGELTPQGGRGLLLSLDAGEVHLGSDPAADRYDRARFARARLGIDTEAELKDRARVVSEISRMPSREMVARARELGEQNSFGRRIEKAYWRRFAFPLMSLVFGVVGAAIALGAGASGRARGAVVAMLAVVGYYVLTRVGDLAVQRAPGTPLGAAFGPDVVVLALALVALARAGRPR